MGSRNVGFLVVNYAARLDLADAMKSHLSSDTAWSSTMFYFIYWG